jgi:2-iminobutanoate/2-iminopropanoate deaminase
MAQKRVVAADGAPQAIGPYSQAIVYGNLVYCSGQIPLDAATGQLVPGGVAEQTAQVLDNLKAVLDAAGSSLDRVLKTTVYMKDMGEFPAMNAVYGNYFHVNPPARATIEAARLPRDARVEIDCIAAID